MEDKKAIVVGISGCSSSGKTTLARLLRDIFPNTFILHEDDFYKPEEQLPIRDGLVDWDCAEAISVPDMEAALRHIHETGTFPVSPSPSSQSGSSVCLSRRSSHGCVPPSPPPPPPPPPPPAPSVLPPSRSTSDPKLTTQSFIASKEDQNSVGACPVPDSAIAAQKARVAAWLAPSQRGHRILGSQGGAENSSSSARVRVCLVDGFLLYTPAVAPVMRGLDVKLFLLVSRARATQRREARDGYVTLEGFWKDPPGYVDKIVWPNYAESHAWLFEGGDVERGRLDGAVLREQGIRAQVGEGLDVDMTTTLDWAVGTIMAELERLVLGEGKS